MSRGPTAAVGASDTLSVSTVGDVTVVELIVTSAPSETVASAANPDPLILTSRDVASWPSTFGTADVTVTALPLPPPVVSMLVANSEVLPLTVRVVAVTAPPHPPAGCANSAVPSAAATPLAMNVTPGPLPPGDRLVR